MAVQEVASTPLCTDNNELQANLHRFWEVESIGILERSEFQQQIESGIIERVPKSQEKDKGCYFLPHHGIIRQDKQTTKLRIVFDGFSKAKGCSSLNECLDKGPNLTPHVFNILVRFRVHRVGLVAAIEKALHQIVRGESDCNLLRFLWFKNVKDEQPKIIQLDLRPAQLI